MADNSNAELVFLPLGGVGEIGMNFALYGYGPRNAREWLVIDVGVTFPGAEYPGVDLVLPDIRFIEEHVRSLRGIVITHAHEDHYGALLDLWPRLNVPVWMTPFAAGLLESKRASEAKSLKIPVEIYKAGERFDVGPFSIEAIGVTHSIPEPVSLAITTPVGTVIHTGDWKIDPAPTLPPLIDEAKFRQYGDRGVAALICDSTNALREGESPSEQAVGEGISEVIAKAPGRVAITTFSSNVGRIKSIAEAALANDRQVLVLGRSLKRVIDVATEVGYLENLPPFVSEEDYGYIPRDKVVILCTGSQGEPRAALAKLARNEFRNVALSPGDIVVYSSRTIPGNEKPILETKNLLIEQGVRIIEDSEALVHVSGHPRRNELRKMYEWVRPRIAVPVHGEAAHLVAHGQLARDCGVTDVQRVRNGDIVKLAPGPSELLDKVPVGRMFKDGRLIGDEATVGVKDRRKLAFAGHVSMNVVLDERYELAGDPDLVAIGLPEQDGRGDDFEEMLLEAAIGAFDSIPRQRRKDLDLVAEAVRRAVRSAANEAWGKKPIVTVFVTL